MRKVLVTLLLVLCLVSTPTAVSAQQTALVYGSKHTTAEEFNNGTLTNMSTEGSGESASVVIQSDDGFYDGFEDGDLSEWADDPAAFGIDSDAHSGGNALVYTDDGDTAPDELSRVLDSSAQINTTSLWLKLDGTNAHHPELALDSGENNPGPYLGFTDSGGIEYYDGSSWQSTGITVNTGEYYQIELTDIDYGTDTYDVTVSDSSGNTVGSFSGAEFWNDVSSVDRFRFYADSNQFHADDIEVGDVSVSSAQYTSAVHSVTSAEQANINITELSNATATISVVTADGGTEQVLNSTTISSPENVTLAIDGFGQYQIEVDVEPTGTDPQFSMAEEGILFVDNAPDISNVQPADGTQVDGNVSLSADITDPQFGTLQGETVTVEFLMNGDVVGTDTLSSAGTATAQWNVNKSGVINYTVRATDEYGLTNQTEQTLAVPSELIFLNETNPSQQVDNVEVTATFFDSNVTITANTTDGSIMIPANVTGPVIVQADADGYRTRTVYIEDILEQSRVFLLPEEATATQARFVLNDVSGTFTQQSRLYIEKPITINGTTRYRTIVSDQFGVDGVTTFLEQGVRYDLRIVSETGEVAQLGSYDAQINETVELQPSAPSIENPQSQTVLYSALYDSSAGTIEVDYVDPTGNTDSVTIGIVARDGSPVLKPNQTYDSGNVSITVPVSGLNETYVVYIQAERGTAENVDASVLVGPQTLGVVPGELSPVWVQILSAFGIFLVGGAFSRLNVHVGALVTAMFGGVLWYLGAMSSLASGALVAVAIGFSVVNLMAVRR